MKIDKAIEILCAYGIPQNEEEFREALEMGILALQVKKNPYIAQIKVDTSLISDFIDNLKEVCITKTIDIQGEKYISVKDILSVFDDKAKKEEANEQIYDVN